MHESDSIVLKSGELYFVQNANADLVAGDASGLYLRDTRFLQRPEISFHPIEFNRLGLDAAGYTSALRVSGNRPLELPGKAEVRANAISLEERFTLSDVLQIECTIQSYGSTPTPVDVECRFAADFRDLFDIRGWTSDRRGEWLTTEIDGAATVRYRSFDGQSLATVITCHLSSGSAGRAARAGENEPEMRFEIVDEAPPVIVARGAFDLEPGGTRVLTIVAEPRPALLSGLLPASAHAPSASPVSTDAETFNRVLSQSRDDLDVLHTCFPDGCMPAAGIPWFVAPFGRDSLIVGLQTLHLAPERAASTLRTLARLQGSRIDSNREEEPGKILHEMRYGEMARTGEVPHSPYYGSIDATPLFVLLFAESVDWTQDEQLYADLLPNALRAVDWMAQFGDKDGDGLIEYEYGLRGKGRLVHPVWKDSVDSLHDLAGNPPPKGLVAPIEVQGYAFAALSALGRVVNAHGNAKLGAEFLARAEALRTAVEQAYWDEDEGWYAQALDREKRQIGVGASNPGHLLYCGLPSHDRATRMASRLACPDFMSGWGIRTMSSAAPAYNPMSYHNGSVWPHDNSLIAAGLHRYGFRTDGNRILSTLIAAAASMPHLRLPELYCGFARLDGSKSGPVPYPVSCSPQAWAAGSLPLLLRAMLGLEVDLANRALVVRPSLPDWLSSVTIEDLRVLGVSGQIVVRRGVDGYDVETEGLPVLAQV